jgi:hypothetical protein
MLNIAIGNGGHMFERPNFSNYVLNTEKCEPAD